MNFELTKSVQPGRRFLGRVKVVFHLRVILLTLLTITGLCLLQGCGPEKKVARKAIPQIQLEPAYVPGTDLSRSDTGGAHTTYRLALGTSTHPTMNLDGNSTDIQVLKNLRGAYGIPENGGSGTIAIVVAYDHSTARDDLTMFSKAFDLPVCMDEKCLEIISVPQVSTTLDACPQRRCGWDTEAALDLQWVHAIAPMAKLILVEAATNNMEDMFEAVNTANKKLHDLGGGIILLSWGQLEGTGSCQIGAADEAKFEKFFSNEFIYLASSGDSGQYVSYPAASANVVSVGGTFVNFDQNGSISYEAGWPQTGGGNSQFIAKPDFQQGIENTSPNHRSTPDIALYSNPVLIFNGAACEGIGSGRQHPYGTSVAVVLAAGLVNVAGHNKTTATELKNIYANYNNVKKIRDIVNGNSPCCAKGYDTFTGVGTPASLQFDAP